MNINNIKELGKLLKQSRKSQGLTQADVALVSGVSIRLVVELENGTRSVSFEKILKICSVLNLTIDIE